MANLFNIPWLTESIKKCTIKYLIERYLGHFLHQELDFSQLDIELFNGTASIESIPLNVHTINQEVSRYLPVELERGFVNRIELSVPWSALWTDSCAILLDGIRLNFWRSSLAPAKNEPCPNQTTSILSKSMMASSMEMAEEILQPEPEKYEGLEKFAQLINSIIRRVKLSATDTVIKFVFPRNGFGQDEIELSIGNLRCEEEEIVLDSASDPGAPDRTGPYGMMLSDVVTKRITVEGLQLSINQTLVSKLAGKHTFKLRFAENKIDLEAFFGSYIFAILNWQHFRVLGLFAQMLDQQHQPHLGHGPKERPMTSQDYRHIREMWHRESAETGALPGGKPWTTLDGHQPGELPQEEFISFHQQQQQPLDDRANDHEPGTTLFLCSVKIPGIMLCVLSDQDHEDGQDSMTALFDRMPTIDNLIGINRHLNELLHHHNHVRLLASNLCVELRSAGLLTFSCINIGCYEYHRGTLTCLFRVKDDDAAAARDTIMPSVRLRKSKHTLNLNLAPTWLRIDPTVVERHPPLFRLLLQDGAGSTRPGSRTGSRPANEMALNVECQHLQLELYFPVPDLRSERNEYSALRDETLLLELEDIRLRVDGPTSELLCCQVDIDLRTGTGSATAAEGDQHHRKLFHSRSEKRNIKLHVSTAVPLGVEAPEEDPMTGICSMSESVNFLHTSAIRPDLGDNKPFQVKRSMVDGGADDEEIVTPGDRDHIRHHLAYNRELTKLYAYIQVPYGQLYLESHETFELIYNRLANDLIFWRPFNKQDRPESQPPQLILPKFCLDREEDSPPPLPTPETGSSIFYSCSDRRDSTASDDDDHEHHTYDDEAKPQNDFVLELEMEHLCIDFPTRRSGSNSWSMQNFLLGVIGGDSTGTVVSLCSENLSYKLQDQLLLGNHSHLNLVSELNTAIEIRRAQHQQALKKIKLAVQLKNSLLFGLDIAAFEQLWQFVNVTDEPILGYQAPTVSIELHINLVKSGVLFHHLQERPALLHLEHVYLTSMVVENTHQTVLRFFIEEALLCFKRNARCPDTWHNFVSVLDSGIIDINLKISDNGQVEWKGSNNEINLRVCHDSLAALCQFLQSFGSAPADEQPAATAPGQESASAEIHVTRRTDDSDVDNHQLIADALVECDSAEPESGLRVISSSSLVHGNEPLPCMNCSSESSKSAPGMEESNFLILGENDLGSGINTSGEPKIRILDEAADSIRIVENHFAITHYNLIPEIGPGTVARYLLDRMSLQVYLFAGNDFDEDEADNKRRRSAVPDAISQARMSLGRAESGRSEPRVRFQQNSVLWENIDIGGAICGGDKAAVSGFGSGLDHHSHYSLKSNGGPHRKPETYVVLVLKNIKMLLDQFNGSGPMSWMFLLLVEEVTIVDQVSVSKIKKMLYEYYSDLMPRRKYSNMFSVRFNCYRNLQDQREEGDLTISLKPLRINVDQDTLFFLMEFFSNLSETLNRQQPAPVVTPPSPPDDDHQDDEQPSEYRARSSGSGSLDSIFIKSFTFCPEVPIRLDYHGKHIDLKQGPLRGVALGLAQLNQSELCLKKLVNKHGLLGLDKVLQYAIEEWAKDIKRNQLPSILGGVGPLHSFIQLFQGIRDLFWIPIDQYRRDQRIVRGIQRGAYAFSVSTAMATLELANRLVMFIQSTAQFAHDVVTPPSTAGRPGGHHHHQQHHHHQVVAGAQPRDVREGLTVALAVVRHGMHDTVMGMTNQNLVADDAVTVIGQVVRQIPSTVVRPVIHLSQATNSVLMGLRNQFAPEARKDDQEKWKNANQR